MNVNRLYRILAFALALTIAASQLFNSGCAASPAINDPASVRTGLKLNKNDKLLIVAPHPDDEVLSSGGIIQQAIKLKIPVQVIMMTNGDGYKRAAIIHSGKLNPGPDDYRKLGEARQKETVAGLKAVGLSRSKISFLCYPDGGLDALFTRYWDRDKPRRGANGSSVAPYRFAYEKNALYCGDNVVKNLSAIISEFRPTTIVFPGPEDLHHDHWATNAFIEYTLTSLRYRCRGFTYLIHRGKEWPLPPYLAPKDYLLPPISLTDIDAHWFKVPMSTNEESKKLKAVSCYKTQLKPSYDYLESFVRRNELVAVYPDIFIEPQKRTPDFFTHPALHGRIMLDPANDTFLNELAGFGDIRSVGFAYNNRKLWFALDTQGGIHQSLTYAFHMRIFKKKEVTRLDLTVVDGVPKIPHQASNSLNPKYSTRIRMGDSRLVVELPDDFLKDAEYVMVNADTYVVGQNDAKWIDRTGWRRIVL